MKTKFLDERAYKYALGLHKKKQHPAAIIAAGNKKRSYKLARTGPVSFPIFGKLRTKLTSIGELYAKVNGNYIGCCAEVNAGNSILIENPYLNLDEVLFSKAIRPRTMQKIATCKNCKLTFS